MLFFWVCSAASWLAVEPVLWTVRLTLVLPLPCRTPQWADLSDQHQTGKAGSPAGAAAVSPVPRSSSPVCRSSCLWSERACEADQGGTAGGVPASGGVGLGATAWPSCAMNAGACCRWLWVTCSSPLQSKSCRETLWMCTSSKISWLWLWLLLGDVFISYALWFLAVNGGCSSGMLSTASNLWRNKGWLEFLKVTYLI